MKPRISAYVPDDVFEQLKLICERPGVTQSAVISAALKAHLQPDEKKIQAVLERRLDQISRHLGRQERTLSVTVETLALFVRYFLMVTPPLPQDDTEAARALGQKRFEFFIAQVGKRLASEQGLISEALERITESEPDLFLQKGELS